MNTVPAVGDPRNVSDAGRHQRVPNPPPPQGANFMIQTDPCWADDPVFLVKPTRLIEFFPVADQSLSERVNALSRLVMYMGIGVAILEKRSFGLQMAVVVLGIICLLWKTASARDGLVKTPNADDAVESFDVLPATCTEPSAGNPYMNYVVGDPASRGPACVGPGTEQMVKNYFEEGLYSDVTDNVFMDPGNPRTFLTQPVTTMPNDRDKLAEWLYADGNLGSPDRPRTMPLPYSDERSNRQLVPTDIRYNDSTANYPPL